MTAQVNFRPQDKYNIQINHSYFIINKNIAFLFCIVFYVIIDIFGKLFHGKISADIFIPSTINALHNTRICWEPYPEKRQQYITRAALKIC